jgi:glutaminase
VDKIRQLFAVVEDNGYTTAERICKEIEATGISLDDFRLTATMSKLNSLKAQPIDCDLFAKTIGEELIILNKILLGKLIIPDWSEFCSDIDLVFREVARETQGSNADYIPILRDADPEKWGVAVCTVDGQQLGLGDVDVYHSIQSVCKPLNYAYALAKEGLEFTHKHVGVEPSGRRFNDLTMLADARPYNPCVNAGAIMTAGIVASGLPDLNAREITQQIMDLWSKLCGYSGEVLFSQETMESERDTADTNFAIAHLLRGQTGLPRGVDLQKMMEVYLSCCSIEMTAKMLSIAAATLANGGVCPITGEQVLATDVVKKTLSIMQMAGMYDNAGTFVLEVGLPAKSGVAGALLVVVPNLLGFATFSPRLDEFGNSVRGVSFCRQLVDRFTFHMYDSLSGGRSGCKRDPRASQKNRKHSDISDLRWALSFGDLYATKVRDLILECMISVSLADGELEDAEIETIGEIYAEIMGEKLSSAELEAIALSKQELAMNPGPVGRNSPFANLIEILKKELPVLDDNARELILESAFRVACADGEVEEKESQMLQAISKALDVSEGVLELEIALFQRRMVAT